MIINVGDNSIVITIFPYEKDSKSILLDMGNENFNLAIVAYVNKEFNISIGSATAERVKQEVGCAIEGLRCNEIDVRGKSLVHNRSETIFIHTKDLIDSFNLLLSEMVQQIKMFINLLSENELELLNKHGVLLKGECGMLVGLDAYLERELSLKVVVAQSPFFEV